MRQHQSLCAGVLCLAGDVDRPCKRRIGYANQNRHASGYMFTGPLDYFLSQAVAKTRAFTGGTKDKQGVYTAGKNVLD
jgi:hypothetical protein